jgi:predicted TIM-barrel fold metal-dependent hydrolase
MNRWTFLGAPGGLGAFAALATVARALGDPASARRIDVHRHVSPPFYADTVKAQYPNFPPELAAWTPERCLADMDAGNIETGILSMPPQPGLFFGDVEAAEVLCRDSNDYMAALQRENPGRFGMFAALPLPNLEGSMAEIAYALDTLKADGVGVWTSYGEKHLSNPTLAPLWAELQRRKAVVFVHGTGENCCAMVDPTFGETARRYTNIRFVVPSLKRYFYDVGLSAQPNVPVSQLVLGSGYPFTRAIDAVNALTDSGLSAGDKARIGRENGLALLRR